MRPGWTGWILALVAVASSACIDSDKVRDLTEEGCMEPCPDFLPASLALVGCTHPDNDFPVPLPLVSLPPPYQHARTDVAYLMLHIVSCEGGTINGTEIGPVTYALTGIYIQPPSEAPDIPSPAYGIECVTDSDALRAWLAAARVSCDTGTVTVSEGATGLSAEVQAGQRHYQSHERPFLPTSVRTVDVNTFFGLPGNATLISESLETTLANAMPGVTDAEGGYLGSLFGGRGELTGITSAGRSATITFQATTI